MTALARHRGHWTAAENARLRLLWGEKSLREIAAALGRTRMGAYKQALALKLKTFAPEGWESLTAAGKRTGFDPKTLRRIFEWAERVGLEAPVERTPWCPKWKPSCKRRKHVVDAADVDFAIEAWMAAETMEGAAKLRGTHGTTIKRILRAYGTNVPPKLPGNQRRAWRVPSEIIDAALAKRKAAYAVTPLALRGRPMGRGILARAA